MGVPAGPRDPVHTGAVRGGAREVVSPLIVYGSQRDALFTLAHIAPQDLLPPCMNLIPLSLQRHFIAVQKNPRVEALPLYQALERVGIVAISFVERSVSHHQV